MALLKCPDCEKMVSPRVEACPFCGCPREFFEDCEAINQADSKDSSVWVSKNKESNDVESRKASLEEVKNAANKIESIIKDYVKYHPEQDSDELLRGFLKKHIDVDIEQQSDNNTERSTSSDSKEDNSTIKYSILGNLVTIPVEVQNERYITKKLSSLISKVRNDYEVNYSKQSDCDAVLRNASDMAFNSLYPVIEGCVSVLNEQGIYTMDPATFIEKYCTGFLIEYTDVLDAVESQIRGIESQQEKEKRYRELRKDSRGRVVGGGFGLGGALKGMATAGAINATTGMVHSLGNAIGNAGTNAEASSNRNKLYNDAKTPLTEAVISAAYKAKDGLRKALKNECGIVCKYVTKSESEQANVIVSNSLQRKIPKEQELLQLVNALKLDPYSLSVYEQIWELYGDENHELRKMAAYFEVPLSGKIKEIAKGYGKNLFEGKCKYYIDAFDKTKASIAIEDNVKEVLNTLIEYCTTRSIEEETIEEITTCKQLLDSIDKELRTVEDVTYETREIAENVRADYHDFYALLSNRMIGEESTYELLMEHKFLSEEFKADLPKLYEKECILRNPEKILENIYELVKKYKDKGVLEKANIIIPDLLGDYLQKEQNVKTITSMPADEVPLIMFDRAWINKSAVLITNKFVRSFSKLLFISENNAYDIEKMESIQCVADDKYVIKGSNQEDIPLSLKVKKASAEEQIAIGKMLNGILRLIRNLEAGDRKNLHKTLNKESASEENVGSPETELDKIFCTSCGNKILRTAKFCNFCGAKNNYKG